MSEEKDDIEKLLSDYKEQRDLKEQEISMPEPPKQREELIDFSKQEEPKKTKKPKKSPEELQALKQKRKDRLNKIVKTVFSKKVLIPFLAVVLIIALVFGISFAVGYSKTAYLKPYQEKYKTVKFPDGILEQYCDIYGENPSTVGYIKSADLSLDRPVTKSETAGVTKDASQFNYVVYLDGNDLEKCYNTADAYNSSSKEFYYSDLFGEYTFQVIGAYYTNTKPDDDNGYVFPYNVTEVMTFESKNQFVDRSKSRFLYTVECLELTRQDTLLTLSCPADGKKDYRFVAVAKAVDKCNTDLKAKPTANPHLTQAEYDTLGKENPYRFSGEWYPEIIVTASDGSEKTKLKPANN